MMPNTPFDDQVEFMQACGQNVDVNDTAQFDMYLGLIDEEVAELNEARRQRDIVETADAIIDILVVAIGAGLSLGLPMQALWDEVMRSNMSKVMPDGTVHRRADGKVLKPLTYSPPDIERVLREHHVL
jgi:predicted HAD superfamily Cof-like phosphohydrolase